MGGEGSEHSVVRSTQVVVNNLEVNPNVEKTNPALYAFAQFILTIARFFLNLFSFTSKTPTPYKKVTLLSEPKIDATKQAEENFNDLKKLLAEKIQLVLNAVYENHMSDLVSKAQEKTKDLSEKIGPIINSLSELSGNTTILENRNLNISDIEWLIQGFVSKDQLIKDVYEKVKGIPHPENIDIEDYIASYIASIVDRTLPPDSGDTEFEKLIYNHVIEALFKDKIERVQQALRNTIQFESERTIREFLKKVGETASKKLGDTVVKTLEGVDSNFSSTIDGIVEDANHYLIAASEAEKASDPEATFAQHLTTNRPSEVAARKIVDLRNEENAELKQQEVEKEYYTSLASKIMGTILPQQQTSDGQRISSLEALYNDVAQLPPELKSLKADLKKIYELGMPEPLKKVVEIESAFGKLGTLTKDIVLSMEPQIVDGIASALKVTEKMFSDPDCQNEVMQDSILPSAEEQTWEGIAKELLHANVGRVAFQVKELIHLEHGNEKGAAIRNDIVSNLVAQVKSHTSHYDWRGMTLAKAADGELQNREERLVSIIKSLVSNIQKEIQKVAKNEAAQDPTILNTTEKVEVLGVEQIRDLLNEYLTPNANAVPEVAEETVDLYADFVDHIAFRVGKFGSFTHWIAGFKRVRKAIGTATVEAIGEYRTSIHPTLKSSLKSIDRTLSQEKIDALVANHTLEKLNATKAQLVKEREGIKLPPDCTFENLNAKGAEIATTLQTNNLSKSAKAKLKIQLKKIELAKVQLATVDSKLAKVEKQILNFTNKKTESDQKIAARKEERDKRLADIGNLFYDKVVFSLRKSSLATRFVAKAFVGFTPKHLNNLVSRVIKTTLGNPKRVQSLFFQVFERTADAIKATTAKPLQRKTIKQIA